MWEKLVRISAAMILSACPAMAQADKPPAAIVAGIPVNYDEARVGAYTLPDPLLLANGKPVRDAKTWNEKRRAEIVRLFEENQYGRSPGRPAAMSFDVFDKGAPALDGKAIRRQVTIYFSADKAGPKMELLVYVPANAAGPVPLLLNLGFSANSSTVNDPGVKVGEVWGRDKKRVPAGQGMSFGRVNVARLLDAGFGFATVYYGDIDPDFRGGVPHGVRALYLKPGQTEPAPDEWGSIAAWAWGLSRAMDYLETDKGVDATRVAIMGVSRLGKTVMWAGARDPRVGPGVARLFGGVGGGARAADLLGDCRLFRRGRRGVEPPQLRRDHRTPDGSIALSLSVRRQLCQIRQPGGSAPGGWAHAGRADRAPAGPAPDGR